MPPPSTPAAGESSRDPMRRASTRAFRTAARSRLSLRRASVPATRPSAARFTYHSKPKVCSRTPFKTPSVDQVRLGGTAPGTARRGASAFSTLTRAASRVRGARSRRVSGGAPTSTVMTSRSSAPLRVGLLRRSASSSRGRTPRPSVASHARTSASRAAGAGGVGSPPSRNSNTTGMAPASAAVSAARRAKDAARAFCVRARGFGFVWQAALRVSPERSSESRSRTSDRERRRAFSLGET